MSLSDFGTYFREADQDRDGVIGTADAAAFFPRFGLPNAVLHQVWSLALSPGAAALSSDDFFLALKLVSLLQRGAPSLSQELAMQARINNSIPLPLLPTQSHAQPPSSPSSPLPPGFSWNFGPEFRQKYAAFFTQLVGSLEARLSSAQAVPFFTLSQLPSPTLSLVWKLSERSFSGSLSFDEFLIASKLVEAASQGVPLPSSLPAELLDAVSPKPSSVSHPSLPPATFAATPAAPLRPTLSQIPPDKQAHYLQIWQQLSPPGGKLNAHDVKEIFMKSGLARDDLNAIWNLADADHDQHLSQEEFVVAMFLLHTKRTRADHPTAAAPTAPTTSNSSVALESHKAAVSELQRQVFNLNQESSSMTQQLNENSQQLTQLQREQEALRHQAAQLEAQCAEKKSQLEIVQNNTQSIQSSLTFERQRVEGLKAALSNLEKELQDSMAQNAQIKNDFESSSSLVAQLTARKLQFEQHLEQQRSQASSNELEVQQLQQYLAQQTEMATKYQAMIASQMATREQLQQQYLSQQHQLDTLSHAAETGLHQAQSFQPPIVPPTVPVPTPHPPPTNPTPLDVFAAVEAAKPTPPIMPRAGSLVDVTAASPGPPASPPPLLDVNLDQPPLPPPRFHIEESSKSADAQPPSKKKKGFGFLHKKDKQDKKETKQIKPALSAGHIEKSPKKEKTKGQSHGLGFLPFGSDKSKKGKPTPHQDEEPIGHPAEAVPTPVIPSEPTNPPTLPSSPAHSQTLDLLQSAGIDFSASPAPPTNPFLASSESAPPSFNELFTNFAPISDQPFNPHPSTDLFATTPNPFASSVEGSVNPFQT